ncbi:hypothetical protein M2352_003098 [Azospirillum fermentarium]|uniref:hypothetical protein n=1 Tax=Azospirillum fermentarium TaxID=1233114 RepID=UPI002225BB41|nr:hypothetical protein [Azospirillum fermentarium]MCW2247464.1 hypothetical protein [Azospirillum fermentarium]
MIPRLVLALVALLLPPLSLVFASAWPGRIVPAVAAAAGAAVLFFVWTGPGLLLWLAAGIIAAVTVLRKR